jgi:hypothetical protein
MLLGCALRVMGMTEGFEVHGVVAVWSFRSASVQVVNVGGWLGAALLLADGMLVEVEVASALPLGVIASGVGVGPHVLRPVLRAAATVGRLAACQAELEDRHSLKPFSRDLTLHARPILVVQFLEHGLFAAHPAEKEAQKEAADKGRDGVHNGFQVPRSRITY